MIKAIFVLLAAYSLLAANISITDPLFRQGARVDYLIIAPADSGILGQAQRLATSKLEKGLQARIVTVDSIMASVAGADTLDKIRNLIKSAWQEWGVMWVLLMGDFHLIPPGQLWSIIDDPGPWIPGIMNSDFYYACLETDWDMDHDGVCGNERGEETYTLACRYDSAGRYVCDSVIATNSGPDLFPDVYLGRLPVSNSSEAAIIVDKILAYGGTPQSPSSTDILFLGEKTTGLRYSDEDSGYIGDASYYWHRGILPILKDTGSALSAFGVSEVYEDTILDDGRVVHDSILRDVEAYKAALCRGSGLVYYMGHGAALDWEICSFQEPHLYFRASDAASLHSSSYMNIITISCMNMAFNGETSIAKNFLLNPNGGAISYSGSSNEDYAETNIRSYKCMAEFLAKKQVTRICQAGELALKENVYWALYYLSPDRQTLFAHQFWGDPELELWTKPVTSADTFAIRLYGEVGNTCLVQVEPRLDSVLVCMYKKDGLFMRGYTQEGEVRFPEIPLLQGVTVTATKHDYLPSKRMVNLDEIAVEKVAASEISEKLIRLSPNPFQTSVQIRVSGITPVGMARLSVIATDGRVVMTCEKAPKVMIQGFRWDMSNLASGVYFLRIMTAGGSFTKKMMLCR